MVAYANILTAHSPAGLALPTFRIWAAHRTDGTTLWVYAIDEFDARQQIASTLRLDAHDEFKFHCSEDDRFKMPLNKILHSNGEWMEVPPPRIAPKR